MRSALGNSFRIHNKKLPDFIFCQAYRDHHFVISRLLLNLPPPELPPPISFHSPSQKWSVIP